jgi:hypothetical protein
MKRIKELFLWVRVPLLAGVCCLMQLGSSHQVSAQSTQTDPLQSNVISGLSCAPSNNGTGHMICGEELSNPTSGGPTLLGGVSWQVDGNAPFTGGPFETIGQVHQITSVTLPDGPFTSTPGCAKTNDVTGFAICAFQGTNNGLYGIAIHPQPTTSNLKPVALLMPGQLINILNPTSTPPCTAVSPCNRFVSVAGSPSCAAADDPTGSNMVICGVVVLMQSNTGAAVTALLGIAFDPRMPLTTTTTGVGANPAIAILEDGTFLLSDPSCTDDVDTTGKVNGGFGFAACGILSAAEIFNEAHPLFGITFDPRTHGTLPIYNPGPLVATTTSFFSGDPSCATPRDQGGDFTCAVGVGSSQGFGAALGPAATLLGVSFNAVSRAVATQNLGAPTAAAGWSGVGCASPNSTANTTTVACAAITSANTIVAMNFDPRHGTAPQTMTVDFRDPNITGFLSLPSCVSENVIHNQIDCGIVDSFGTSKGFVATLP